jgi:large subunit ribosomal protein L5
MREENMTRLLEQYRTKVLPELKSELKLSNDLAVPRIEKIVVNAGVGKILQQQPKDLESLTEALRMITGQQPVVKKAKKAIAGFKLREGQIVGLVVTLRGKRMYDFLDKLINVALPRTRDFRGLSKTGFDKRGNFSIGLREHLVFPEMAQEDLGVNLGLMASIITTAKNDEQAYKLLKKFRFPFKD